MPGQNASLAKGSPSFGSSKLLNTLGKVGNDAGMVTMSTSLAIMALRPIVTLMDKNAEKDEKIYAAAWIFALSAVGFTAQALLKRPFDKIAAKVSKDVLKLTGDAAKGAGEFVKYGLFNAAAIAYTYLNTRYVGRVMDFFSEKITGKPFRKDKKQLTPEEEAKDKKKDKMIFSVLGAAGAFIGLNMIGRALTGRPIASDALSKGIKSTVSFLQKNSGMFRKLQGSLGNLKGKMANWAQGHTSYFTKQATAGGEWITRNMMANAIVRPVIALFSGQPYVAIRCFIDEGIGILAMKGIGRPLSNAAAGPLTKFFQRGGAKLGKAELTGIKALSDQLIMNIGVLCIALGFFNNAFSKKVVSFMDKFKKNPDENKQNEQEYKEFRRQFIPAVSLNSGNLRVQHATNPEEWLSAINDPGQVQATEGVIKQFKTGARV